MKEENNNLMFEIKNLNSENINIKEIKYKIKKWKCQIVTKIKFYTQKEY